MAFISNRIAAHIVVLSLSLSVLSSHAFGSHGDSAQSGSVKPLKDAAVNEASMAELLSGSGVTISNPSYSAVMIGPWYNRYMNQEQAGQFSGFSFLLGEGFDEGVILSTGKVSNVLGPNSAANKSTAFSSTAVQDPDLGNNVFDPVKFSFTVIPDNEVLVIDFVFGSEEYSEYVGAPFNDLARIFVGDQNCALTPAGDEVRVNNIHAAQLPSRHHGYDYPNNNDGISNTGIYLDNSSASPSFNTEMDGYTRRLSCRVAVMTGMPVNVVVSIADIADAKYDSWVFFRADSIRSESATDYGDAPDSYGTLSASFGAAHTVVEGVRIGDVVGALGLTGDDDGFVDGIDNSAGQASDDSDNALVDVPKVLSASSSYSVSLNATSLNGKSSTVIGWVDFDLDGKFQTDEASAVVTVAEGSYETPITLNWNVGGSGADVIANGSTYLRLRIANEGLSAATSTGLLASGEVEDYRVVISDGQAPVLNRIERLSPLDEVTAADSVTFRVVFSEAVNNVDAADFTVSAGVLGSVTSFVGMANQTAFDISVTGLASFDGVVSIGLAASNDIADAEGVVITETNIASVQTYTLDNTAPATPIFSQISEDTGVAGDFITADSRLVFSGSADSGTNVSVYIDGELAGVAVVDSENDQATGRWNFDFIGSDLTNGSHNITVLATDAVGNASAESSPVTIFIDTLPPATPRITTISDDLGASANDGITTDTTLVFSGTAEAGQYVTVMIDGSPIGTVSADAGGLWVLDHSATTLADGLYDVTAVSADLAGNTSSTSTAFPIQIDTSSPTAPVVLSVSDDTGTQGDGITSDASLVIRGSGDAGLTIELFIDERSVGETIVGEAIGDDSGAWSFDYSNTILADGDYIINARGADVAGNAALSDDFALTVDTSTPAAAILTAISDDTGLSSDFITSDQSLEFLGTAEPGAKITVLINGSAINDSVTNALGNEVVADSNGQWRFDYRDVELADGVYSLTLIVTDIAGNEGPESASIEMTVDSTAPSVAEITHVSEDTGVSATDGMTADSGLVISGRADIDSTVDVLLDGIVIGTVSADASGVWRFDYSATYLADGEYTLTAIAKDAALNTAAASTAFEVTIDTQAPTLVTFAENGQTLKNNQPSLSGTADVNARITVIIDGDNEYTTVADDAGQWTLAVTIDLENGEHSVITVASDDAGNEIIATGSVTIDVSVSAANSSIDASPLIIPANGSTAALISIEIRDSANNPVPGLSPSVTTDLGTISNIQALGNGLYSAELTAYDEVGTASVEVIAGGILLGRVSIEVIAADIDGDGVSDGEEDTNGDGDPTNDDLDGDGIPDYKDSDDDGDGRDTSAEDTNRDGDPTNDDDDGDGIPNYRDGDDDSSDGNNDSDGDGIADTVECENGIPCVDSDGDGVPDYMDGDDDGDGIPTSTEGGAPARDSDADGTPDYLDNDDDNDGTLTVDEDENLDADGNPATQPSPDADGDGIPAYLDPNDIDTSTVGDSDGDGLADDLECANGIPCADTDNDGIPDYRDGDDDGDGIPTLTEGPVRDSDGDDTPDYLDNDDDNDGLLTADEDANTDGDGNPATTPAPDADNDGIPAYLDPNDADTALTGDSDGDGIPDDSECAIGVPCHDSDNDGVPDYADADDDGDGLPTASEDDDSDGDGNPATNPGPDGDLDGIPDYLDPDVVDEDGDGLSNADEDGNRDGDPTNDDLDNDGTPDYLDPDDDGDGLDTNAEDLNGDGDPRNDDEDGDGIPAYLDPNDADSSVAGDADGDGVSDDVECASGIPCTDSDGDGTPDYMDGDDDNDGVPTRIEGGERDTDNDGIPDYRDGDDDGDGIDTINEDHDIDGDGDASTNAGPDDDNDRIPAYLDPNDAETGSPGDSDGDGLTDAQECQAGSPCEDSDGDGQPDYMDADDDNDGRPTATEDPNGDGNPINDDTNGNGLPNYLDPDDDGDGIPTSEEGDGDPDGDSIPDYLDADGPVVLGDGTGDSDGDGLSDLTECPFFTGICRDTDNDGTPDYNDPDDDNDGRPTATEDPDANGDQTNDDTDNDGIPNYRDPDDDGDGFSTIDEGTGDSDDDGIPDYLDPSAGDSDEDGIPDGAECPDGVPCRDSDGDGVPDYVDEDDDNDSIPTVNEDNNGNSDPSDDDTDGDGIPDYLDPDDDGDGTDTRSEDPNGDDNPSNDDSDGDGIPDYRDPDSNNEAGTADGTGDSDNDGVSDGRECPSLPCRDSDGNGTPDYLSPDDDGDGVNTVDEDINKDGDPANDDTDGDGRPDFLDPDDDGDGFDTRDEGDGDRDNDGIPDYLDPTGGDSDGDGLSDASECPFLPCWDSDADGDPNYLDPDDDGDGIPTQQEDPNGNGDPRDDDTDNDGIPNYLDKDDDGDGVPSSGESGTGDADKDGIPDYLDRDTTNQAGMPDGTGDSDGDGLSDAQECGVGSACEDVDNNGTPDYMEAPGFDASVANELLPEGNVASSLPVLGSLSSLWLALLAIPLIRLRKPSVSIKTLEGHALLRMTMLVLAVSVSPGVAVAFEPTLDDVYVGGGVGVSRLTPDTSGTSYVNEDESGFDMNITAGYRLVDDLSIELQYHRLGSATLKDTNTNTESELSYSAFGASVNWYPWQTSWDGAGNLHAYLSAGLSGISNDSDINYDQEAAFSLGLGFGVEYEFKDTWQARIAAHALTRDVQVIQLSVLKRFGANQASPEPVVQRPEPILVPPPVIVPVVVVDQDSDRDGITNNADECPGTPAGMTVNAQGCSVLDARLEGVYFDSGSATLTYGSLSVLKQVINTLKSYPESRVEIGAHTDSLGSAKGNHQLSERRAVAVMQYLIDMGIDAGRLEARGYGEENPIADNSTNAGRAENRRVEIKVIE